LIRVNSGEMILNRRQQDSLFNAIDSGAGSSGGGINISIDGPIIGDDAFVDDMIDKINDRVEFANKQLRVS